jgi:hypothetical protein
MLPVPTPQAMQQQQWLAVLNDPVRCFPNM